jgi:DNA-binding response OmpR family regulator
MTVKKILIADDEEYMRALVRETLDEPEYSIVEAANGIEALDLARSEHPDLLILDWQMPGMSGIDVVKQYRKNAAAARVPFILLTARGAEEDRGAGLSLGAHAYLAKPFSPLELLRMVSDVLGRP